MISASISLPHGWLDVPAFLTACPHEEHVSASYTCNRRTPEGKPMAAGPPGSMANALTDEASILLVLRGVTLLWVRLLTRVGHDK